MHLYEFRVNHRQFRPGDPVPETYPDGVVRTMLDTHRIVPIASEPQPHSKPRGRRANRVATQHGSDG